MSWEVWSMKPRTSLFHKGICRNLLRRCWPLWAAFGLILLLMLPVLDYVTPSYGETDTNLLGSLGTVLTVDFFLAWLTVRFLFGFLFERRGSGMMGSLPLKREGLFCTLWLTGLLPALGLHLLWVLAAWAKLAPYGLAAGSVGIWLLGSACGFLCFYGLDLVCAMLTGSRVIFPLLVLLLNFGAQLLELSIAHLLDLLVYGFPNGKFFFYRFSPAVGMISEVEVKAQEVPHLEGLWLLLVYGAAGLILSALALGLFRGRQLESATDNIAVPAMKPVFRYGLSLIGALLLGVIGEAVLMGDYSAGRDVAFGLLLMLPLGAFLGYFGAEMLLQKSVRVFRGHWKGYLTAALVLILFVACAELDVFGYERRVPAAEEVACVRVRRGYASEVELCLEEQESLALVERAHRGFVEHKDSSDRGISDNLTLSYTLKNGETLTRSYPLWLIQNWEGSNREELEAVEAMLNCSEALEERFAAEIPPEGPDGGYIQVTSYLTERPGDDPYASYPIEEKTERIDLSREELQSLYREGILPDLRAGRMGRIWVLSDGDQKRLVSNVSLRLQVETENGGYQSSGWNVCLDAENCIRWLRENKGIEIIPMTEARKG